ncbi:ankyrin repeat [Fusarium beomiforme]|uniref:Ankyrin repeat n=1 Tax=Fusarium beomiforme TaxID=44412 RepID=A0A9P5DQR6_9HYPO|nr:ankyrin repeat [Fusarium beomiforme]
MLPSQMSQARVMTYDWNANYDKTASKEAMRNHADTLLERVHLNRESLKRAQVPIIFIASCFAGVLLSAALVGALELQHPRSEERRQIFDSCVGIMFLGTPFGGSWDTGTRATRSRIEAAKRADPKEDIQYSMELVQYLKEGIDDSPSPLDDLMHRFQESINNSKHRIPCGHLYETQPAQHAGPLSRLSLEERNSQTVIDQNLKAYPNNLAFQSLCLRLREYSERAETVIGLRVWSQRLSFPDMDRRHLHLKGVKLTAGTCEWLFVHEKYMAWERNDLPGSENSTILIAGKADSGKSTLVHGAVTRTEATYRGSKSICLSYFFDTAKDVRLSTEIIPQGLYRSLLSQLLKKINRSPAVATLVKDWGSAKEAHQATVEDTVTVRIFIDAINKCGNGGDNADRDIIKGDEWREKVNELPEDLKGLYHELLSKLVSKDRSEGLMLFHLLEDSTAPSVHFEVAKLCMRTGIISRYKEHSNDPYSVSYLQRADIANTVWLADNAAMLMLLTFEGCGALLTRHGELCTGKNAFGNKCREQSTVQDAFSLALLRG